MKARALVCSIGLHQECDGFAPNESDYPCSCSCHVADQKINQPQEPS